MPAPRDMLSRDEIVVRHTRTHIKIILWRIFAQILIVVAAAAASFLIPDNWGPWGVPAIWIVALVVSIPVFILPWLAWWSTTYTITTKRVITRSGILSRSGHDLPLSRISDVQQDKSLGDRLFGCGTLSLQTSSDDPLLLEDVPQVEMVQVEISNLLFNDPQGAIDADLRS
ncbi:PH domain-containing protein [Actinomyces bowdenii]|uniref:PH domain-containing protein n=1 Tax=Actinomyces bowdenii TaxID=131109 RepID=A0A3P1V3W2_9ACTO|nr:PH domain-containing protein [Actinomyces bowdenii]RRD28568.1 PH domain-containing protein [Actinomyces bowdenii]